MKIKMDSEKNIFHFRHLIFLHVFVLLKLIILVLFLIFIETIAQREVLRVSVDECTLTIQNVIHENKRKLKIRSLTLSGCSEDIVTLEKAISAHISGMY